RASLGWRDGLVVNVSQHGQSNRRCRTAAAANTVSGLWESGYRDPWTVPGGAPLTWSELQASRWRKQVVIVEFPKWNAVLLRRSQTNGGSTRAPRASSVRVA